MNLILFRQPLGSNSELGTLPIYKLSFLFRQPFWRPTGSGRTRRPKATAILLMKLPDPSARPVRVWRRNATEDAGSYSARTRRRSSPGYSRPHADASSRPEGSGPPQWHAALDHA